MSNNTANAFGGSVINKSYYDLVHKKENVDNRTASEIVDDIKSKLENLR